MTSVVTPINDGFAEALDRPLRETIPWNTRSPSNVRIGTRMRIGRVSQGVSERQFAERLGINRHELYLFESGGKRISANLLLRIAELLEVRLEHFFLDHPKDM
jgi:DNA-binding XRE family transcriptional regulator